MSTKFAGDLGNVETFEKLAIWNKATSASSAIAAGKVVQLNESTGVAAVATAAAGLKGPFGVVPRLKPLNVDSDPTFIVVTGKGAEMYVVCQGAIKPNARVGLSATVDGAVAAFVPAAASASPTEAEVEAAGEAFNRVVGEYVGHVDEGSGLENPASDAADGETIRIKLY